MKLNNFEIITLDTRETRSRVENYFKLLSDVEKQRAARFANNELSQRFICAHGALREILSDYVGLPADQLIFNQNKYGKPYLIIDGQESYLQFNMSHSDHMLAIIISNDKAVGIDIEAVRENQNLAKVSKQYFSTLEYQQFIALPSAEQTAAFYRYWTCKEAFIKAIGQSLSYGLKNISVQMHSDKPVALLYFDKDIMNDWKLEVISAPKGFALAVCSSNI